MFLISIPFVIDYDLQLFHDDKQLVVVGPDHVERALKQHALSLESILVTRDHANHAAGFGVLREAAATPCPVQTPGSGQSGPPDEHAKPPSWPSTRGRGAPVHDDITTLAAIRQ